MCNRSVPLQVAVVARRRSEGTHPINKTTRVTIEFNRRERTGSRRRSWTGERAQGGWGDGGEHPTRSKSPSTYPPLLFIVPNFHSLRTRRAVLRVLARDPEKRRTALADGHTASGICFVRRGERHRFLFLYKLASCLEKS